MKRIVLIAIAISFSMISAQAADDKNIIPADLKSATVYRSGAELLHTAKAMLKQGSSELIIEGISSYVDINSLQINCPAPVTILGVEFSNNYLLTDIAIPAVKKLEDSLDNVNDDIEKLNINITTTTDLLNVLKSNREIKGTQTGLSVAELVKLMDYYKIKSNELQNELASMTVKKRKLNETVSRLTNQINEEKKKNTRSGGRIILQVLNVVAGTYDLNISYITQNAYWTPYYDIKADDIKSPMKITYKAKIIQTTGIDWKKVKLSLSTSTPTQYGNAPVLSTWFMAYIDPVRVMDKTLSKKSEWLDDALAGKVAGAQVRSQSGGKLGSVSAIRLRGENGFGAGEGPIYVVNGTIMPKSESEKISNDAIKDISVLQGPAAAALFGPEGANGAIVMTLKEGLEDYVSVSDNELDVTYDIDLPYDVPTNGKAQIATVKEATMNATYKYYAVPKLDKDAFLLAEVSDWEQLNLLPGEANIIFEGTYIGKTFIDPASTMDTLNLTLGKDKRVVIKREKMKDYSSVKFLGSNKLQKITYDITIKNNKKEAIQLSLKDQYPITTNKEIEVELLESEGATNDAEIGVLAWKLDLAPGESKKVRISYSVKYPKNKLVNLN